MKGRKKNSNGRSGADNGHHTGQPRPPTSKAVMSKEPEWFSPERAAQILAITPSAQRGSKVAFTYKYTQDMLEGLWGTCVDPIVLEASGAALNGQHRLSAIVASGKGQWFFCVRNATAADCALMDQGAPRNAGDYAHFVGSKMDKRRTGIAGFISRELYGENWASAARRYQIYQGHKEVVDFVCSKCFVRYRRGVCQAAVFSAFVVAAYYDDWEALERAGYLMLGDGPPDDAWLPGDKTMVRMASSILETLGTTRRYTPDRIYRMVARALQAYMAGRTLKIIRPATECYKLDEI